MRGINNMSICDKIIEIDTKDRTLEKEMTELLRGKDELLNSMSLEKLIEELRVVSASWKTHDLYIDYVPEDNLVNIKVILERKNPKNVIELRNEKLNECMEFFLDYCNQKDGGN